ncbi:putative protein serine/threonine kinase [Tieghemostelium lacteum]|uniref:Protein kinase domain-containing protein n=1 Tax=Tieghemostelium lacteum TaxID=361077 RepID=A0A152A4W2_TIELA|nr:putative protein serine/threonine kinase [Tieghemostelium lacteum]|eukprot:KYR01270.1 putative protein serine/threonine kinase [Tieghemostelium lacteum]
MWKAARTPLFLINNGGVNPSTGALVPNLSINDRLNSPNTKLKPINNKQILKGASDNITKLAVSNKDVNHMTQLLTKSGISISSYNNTKQSTTTTTQNSPSTTTNTNSLSSTTLKQSPSLNNLVGLDTTAVASPTSTTNIINTLQSSIDISTFTESCATQTLSSSQELTTATSTSCSSSSGPSMSLIEDSRSRYISRFQNDFQTLSTLGKGGFGIVFKVVNKYDEMEYAVKRIIVNKESPRELEEVKTMARLNHPNIVRYYNSWIEPLNQIDHYGELKSFQNQINMNDEDDEDFTNSSGKSLTKSSNNSTNQYITFNQQFQQHHNQTSTPNNNNIYSLYIQMEFCKYGTLKTLLNQYALNNGSGNNNLSNIAFTREIIKQLLVGIKYIHSQGFVHRDLTPDNIFICESPLNIKIGDFGLSTSVESLNAELANSNRKRKGLGTYLYSSVEQEKGDFYNQKTDLYSAGVIFFELLFQFKTIMERTKLLSSLKQTGSIKQTCMSFYKKFQNESKFIDYLIQPFQYRPYSDQIQIESDNFIELLIQRENL